MSATAAPGAPPSRLPRAWLAVVSVAAGTFFLVTSEFLPVGMLTGIAGDLGVSAGQAGLTITLPGIVAAFAAPLLSIAAGRLDRRAILCALSALIIASNALAAGAQHFEVLLLARLVLGVSVGGLWAFGIAAARRLVPEQFGARATAIISAGIGFGTIVGVPAGSLLGAWFGWRATFGATAAFGVLVLAAQLLLLPAIPALAAIGLRQFTRLLGVARARAGLAGIMLAVAGHFLAYTYLEPYLRQVSALAQGRLASVLLVFALAGVVGTFAAGSLARRGTARVFVAATALQALAIALLGSVAWSWAGVTVLVGLWGLAFGAVPVLIQIWTYEAAPSLYEGGAALIVTAFQVGLALGALVGGGIVDSRGIGASFLVGAAVSAAAAAVLHWAPAAAGEHT